MTDMATTLPKIPGLVDTTGVTLLLPDGVTADQMEWGFRFCRSDFRSSNDFRWPFPGQWAEAPGPCVPGPNPCPSRPGDGICVARTTIGATSGGIGPDGVILVVGWLPDDVLADTPDKVRVRRAWVADVVSVMRFVGPNANLRSANLGSANLRSANLGSADLRYADLRSADLRSANLGSADLGYADLRYADLRYADLRSADLRYADLRSADLGYAARGNSDTVLPAGYRLTVSGLIVRD